LKSCYITGGCEAVECIKRKAVLYIYNDWERCCPSVAFDTILNVWEHINTREDNINEKKGVYVVDVIIIAKITVSINIYTVSEGQITHPVVIVGQAVTETNSSFLVSGELNNIHLGAYLPVDEKDMLGVSDEVCSL
jgi:hypothetical protein